MDFNTIEDILNSWLTERLKETVKFTAGKDDVIHINASVLKLENWLQNWRKSNKLNERIDASIISENILKNVDNASSKKAFQAKDYQFNFLFFLARNYNTDLELHELIDSFIEKFKDQFSFADIIVTTTGATRCKTNIRFAVNDLRNMGMVLSNDPSGKRSLRPSIQGLITILNIQFQTLIGKTSFIEKDENTLGPLQNFNYYRGYPNDASLLNSIIMFKDELHLLNFLNWLSSTYPDKKDFLTKYASEYISLATKAVEILESNKKLDKELRELLVTAQNQLFENHERNAVFSQTLLNVVQSETSPLIKPEK